MSCNGDNSSAARAKQLIDRAKQARVLDQTEFVELQRTMEDLVEATFASDTSLFSTPAQSSASAGMYLVCELLD
ncbi:hypothetical protein IWW38_006118, partial [Coemansia aciculifera]